jgi:centrosomal protein CEP290
VADVMKELEDKIAYLEQQNDSLTQDLGEREENYESEKVKTANLARQLEDERKTNGKLQDQMKRMHRDVGNQKRRGSVAGDVLDERQFKNLIKEKNAEISKYISEVQMLSAENLHYSSEVEAMTQELEATVYEIERYGLLFN